MKNIHVLPTDKPSRIYLIKSNNKLGITSNNPEFTENFGSGTQNQHIYITSNEEIKVGDWFIDIFNVIHQTTQSTVVLNTYKKIVLTTDQNLIKDGVQDINDNFLEWFVKNPSCERVDFQRVEEIPSGISYGMFGNDEPPTELVYKIIIPKEDSKYNYGWCKGNVILPQEEIKMEDVFSEEKKKGVKEFIDKHKQETLEEAADKYVENWFTNGDKTIEVFIAGAKWKEERMCDSELIQKIRATLSDAEARRIIKTFKNK